MQLIKAFVRLLILFYSLLLEPLELSLEPFPGLSRNFLGSFFFLSYGTIHFSNDRTYILKWKHLNSNIKCRERHLPEYFQSSNINIASINPNKTSELRQSKLCCTMRKFSRFMSKLNLDSYKNRNCLSKFNRKIVA